MEIEKIRNYSDEELKVQQRQAAEQLFRLRFQLRSGQQEGVKKLRELKKDVARIQTIARDRALHGTEVGAATSAKAKTAAAPAVTKAKKTSSKKAAK